MKIYDKETGLFIADPEQKIFQENTEISFSEVEKSVDNFILSASGWRKIFAANGDEESTESDITNADKIIAGTIAHVYSRFIIEKTGSNHPLIAAGIDTRHTGPCISDIMNRIFLSEGLRIRYLFITAAPEIMAYSKLTKGIRGFVYISASHNPIGHNGIKFGLNSGGVLSAQDTQTLIDNFRKTIGRKDNIAVIAKKTNSIEPGALIKIYSNTSKWKKDAFNTYMYFTKEVVTGCRKPETQQKILSLIRTSVKKTNIGIVAELNGSARTLSIDNLFLKSLGVKIKIINGRPRQITHKIIPEGESLNLCKSELEKARRADSAFIMGYVPDNDGDRGNIVYINKKTGKAHILHAQEVFALACMAELSYMVFQNMLTYNAGIMPEQKTAVAVNGPTSLRIDKIAGAFGAEVFRAEVGEANVVNLASGLRDNGYIVRILGEGSNGGNITHPAAVRDPINTISALLKLLLLRSENDKKGLFEIWCKKSAQMNKYNKDFSITDILAALPSFATTDSSETRAVMKIKTENHGILKEKYRKIFKTQWIEKKAMLEREFGIFYYEELWLQGTNVNKEPDIESSNGGFKILFKNKNHQDTGFIWMRGSGTEPVFRVLADIEGNDPEKEELLLNWHKQMIEKADGSALK